jgi:SAM-dependent methyltransferase
MLETMPLDGHESRYDIVSMNHVLEHVIDPGLVLERALRLLRPGGWLVGQLPARTSWEARLFGRYWGGYHFPPPPPGVLARGSRHRASRPRASSTSR